MLSRCVVPSRIHTVANGAAVDRDRRVRSIVARTAIGKAAQAVDGTMAGCSRGHECRHAGGVLLGHGQAAP